jgi:ABC-type multidrug transport system fused ATPase/permease subunit
MASLLARNCLLMLAGSGLSLVDPLVVRWLIDVALPKRDLRLVTVGTLVFCAVYLSSVGVNYLSVFVSCVITQKIVFRTRMSLLRRLQMLSGEFHSNVHVGDTLYRIQQDVDHIAELSGDILPTSIQMVMLGIMVLLIMGLLNWRLTAAIVPLLPVFYLLQRNYSAKLKQAADSVQIQSGQIGAFLQEHLAGMQQLQLLNRTTMRGRMFAQLAAQGAKLHLQQRTTEMSFALASVSFIVLGMGIILGYGGYQVARGALTVGGLVAFYGYVFRLFTPVSLAIDVESRMQRVGASIRRVLDVMEKGVDDEACRQPLLMLEPESVLEFRSVSFSYDKCRPVLCDVNFRIDSDESVAIVGRNGSGKSTIGLLATRIHDPASGSILLRGQDTRYVSRRRLRALVTLVPQDPFFFDGTIRANLLYGNPQATTDDLDRVAALTQLHEVLRKMPKGFDEPLGPIGARLSGGEKKRLALARTLLQRPEVLILDEITSALDEAGSAGLLERLGVIRQTCTLVVISHRPSTILWADRILVIDRGTVAASGKHDELLVTCEAYRRIWQVEAAYPADVYSQVRKQEQI